MAAARICRGSALHRLIYLVSFSPSVSVSVSQELTYYAHYWRRRSRIWSQTGCYYGGGRILDREEVSNSVCVDSPPFFRQFTTRTYAVGSNCAKARFDGESVASQMIKYAVTCRAQDAMHGEAVRVLEQGKTILLADGAASATAAGRILLKLASFYADRAKLLDAVDVLQQAADLDGASLDVRVAALEALVGVCLRLHQEESGLGYANSCGQLVKASKDQVSKLQFEELEFRSNAIAALCSLVCAQRGAAEAPLGQDLPTWISDNSHGTGELAAAILSFSQCAHVGGQLSCAKDLYERAITIISNTKETSELTLASVAMAPEEVHIGALAGLGQLASHLGDFEQAEAKLTEALSQAEHINGDKHPRVGIILACMADVYACRGSKGTGDIIITEGLYRRALDLLGTPSLDLPDSAKLIDLSDVMALSRARYADVISKAPNRDTEADRLHKWAEKMWKGPQPLVQLLAADASQHSQQVKLSLSDVKSTSGIEGNQIREVHDAGNMVGNVVVDVRLGRVIWKGK
ncbi:unnamed protein product [Sphagnum troendelagicum]|uniref:Uncharacterized protein n=1 Tax=Sphagnum troendelagicum TaxID=128251 RepID=A0ABP0TQA1_9BRYO